jgi:hypothetical protein
VAGGRWQVAGGRWQVAGKIFNLGLRRNPKLKKMSPLSPPPDPTPISNNHLKYFFECIDNKSLPSYVLSLSIQIGI